MVGITPITIIITITSMMAAMDSALEVTLVAEAVLAIMWPAYATAAATHQVH
jgi:hypothetical protein